MKLLIVFFVLLIAAFLEFSAFQTIMLIFVAIGLYSIRKKNAYTKILCEQLSSIENCINENAQDILQELKNTRNDMGVHATMVKKNLGNLQKRVNCQEFPDSSS